MNKSLLGRQESETNPRRKQSIPSPVGSKLRDKTPPIHRHRCELDGEEIRTRAFKAEHLVAIALQTGRPKDKARLLHFIESGTLSSERFQNIIKLHALVVSWRKFEQQFLESWPLKSPRSSRVNRPIGHSWQHARSLKSCGCWRNYASGPSQSQPAAENEFARQWVEVAFCLHFRSTRERYRRG